MKNNKSALINLALFIVLLGSFIACDKDFATIDSDIINNDTATHFDTDAMLFNVVAYNKKLDPVQTNNLPINFLGIYDDPLYGSSIGNVVTSVTPSSYNPTFGENVVLDSVVLTIPLFNTSLEVLEDGETTYELDSVFGSSPIKLSIYESAYFLRDFDPNLGINDLQKYYSNGSTGTDQIDPMLLESKFLFDTIGFVPSEKEIKLVDTAGTVTRLAPSLRFHLNKAFWQEKIFDKEGEVELSNANNFKNYFRGIYFKTESVGPEGTAMFLNIANSGANITVYYSRDTSGEDATRISGTYALSFGEKSINLISELPYAIPPANATDGDEKLYLKGGQGSVAVVNLFDGVIQDPDTGSDVLALDYFKSKKEKWLINEAHLVFYVDQGSVLGLNEPERVYLYDLENGTPLIDYYGDIDNTINPVISRTIHLGRLERVDDDPEGKGIRYKIRITEHVNNILLRDSTNVKLGLAVSANVNLEGANSQPTVLTNDNLVNKVPISSILTPKGTVLFGNNTTNEEKKVYLEIFYTEPKNN